MGNRLCCRVVALLIAVAVAPEVGSAKKRRKGNKSTVALFLQAKNKPSSRLYAALLGELTRTASKSKPVKVLYGKSLRRAIKGKPDRAIAKCGSNVGCIAKLGQKARAELVIYGRVSPDGGGVKAQLLVVDVASSSISERTVLSLSSVSQVKAEVANHLDSLFPAVASAEDEIPLDMILGDEPVEADEAVADASATEAPGGGDLPLDFALEASSETTGLEGEPELTPLALEPPTASPEEEPVEIAAVTPVLATTADTGERDSGGSRVLTYTGIGVAGLGVAALGVGAYFGMQSASTVDSIEYGAGGTTQREAQTLEKDANDQAGMANLMFGVGGGLVAAGAALVVIDLFILDGGGPETSVRVGSESAAAAVTWRF